MQNSLLKMSCDHIVRIFVLVLWITLVKLSSAKPNIVIIMADDLGFDDISFRGSNNFLTPNIDALAFSGVILNNLYTPTMCTPSRAALLTGKYPINTGMQHYVISNDQPWGLPINETTIAQIFQQNGYHTSLFGKWHLGMSRKAYTPTLRGFNKHYGYLGAYIDYYKHTLWQKNYTRGHDFRDNLKVTHEGTNKYVTNLLTTAVVEHIMGHNTTEQPLFILLSHLAPHAVDGDQPLQAPDDEIQNFSYISREDRRIYAAMTSMLDKSVAEVINALSQKGILNNTIILFLSDNGGPTTGLHSTTASNYPLRGQKNSPWEGGIRSSAAIWSAQLDKLGTIWKQKFYIADFLPTLAAAAGIQLDSNLKLDGLNLWSALKYGYEAVEREIVHNIDDIFKYVSYLKGKWKFINGTTDKGIYDTWLGTRSDETDARAMYYEGIIRNTSVWQQLNKFNPYEGALIDVNSLRSNVSIICQYSNPTDVGGTECTPLKAPCLFDIDNDPCEENNLYEQYKNSKMLQEMLKRIKYFRRHARRPNNKPSDKYCDPKFYDNEWTWWQDIRDGNSASKVKLWQVSFVLTAIISVRWVL